MRSPLPAPAARPGGYVYKACCQWVKPEPSWPGQVCVAWGGQTAGQASCKGGNNPAVQQANRPFPGGRRDLIGDHKVGWRQGDSVLPRAEEVLRAKGGAPHYLYSAMELHSRLRGIKWDWWRDWAGFTRQEETGWCSLAPWLLPAVLIPLRDSAEAASAWKASSWGPEQPAPTGPSESLALRPLSSGGAVACTMGTERENCQHFRAQGKPQK